MTTLFLTEKNCVVCGAVNRYPLVDLSMKIMGTRDLDGRPSMTQRSLVYMWIQRCECCNYCSPDISRHVDYNLDALQDDEYNAILDDASYPLTAIAFRAYSYIMKTIGHYADAAWAQLCAAWICDDNKSIEESILCRGAALQLFQKAKEMKQDYGLTEPDEKIQLIDILRRVGRFEEALKICDTELEKETPESVWVRLEYEKYLIEKKDMACHDECEADEHGV